MSIKANSYEVEHDCKAWITKENSCKEICIDLEEFQYIFKKFRI